MLKFPYYVTVSWWLLVGIGAIANNISRISNGPYIELYGFGIALFLFAIVGVVFSIFEIRPFLIMFGVVLAVFGVSTLLSASLVSANLGDLYNSFGAGIMLLTCGAVTGLPPYFLDR